MGPRYQNPRILQRTILIEYLQTTKSQPHNCAILRVSWSGLLLFTATILCGGKSGSQSFFELKLLHHFSLRVYLSGWECFSFDCVQFWDIFTSLLQTYRRKMSFGREALRMFGIWFKSPDPFIVCADDIYNWFLAAKIVVQNKVQYFYHANADTTFWITGSTANEVNNPVYEDRFCYWTCLLSLCITLDEARRKKRYATGFDLYNVDSWDLAHCIVKNQVPLNLDR